jgi:hypothetical protein
MKSGMTNPHALKVLGREFGAEPYTEPTNWFLGVSTTPIQPDGSGVTEPDDGMYERVLIENISFEWENTLSGEGRQNVNFLEFPRAAVDWDTVVAAALFEDETTTTPAYFADLEYTKIVQFNDSLIIEPGELQIEIKPLEV